MPQGSGNYYNVCFLNESLGCLDIGTTYTKRTTDGGQTWSLGVPPPYATSTNIVLNGTYPLICTYRDTVVEGLNYRYADVNVSYDMGLTWYYASGFMGGGNRHPRLTALNITRNNSSTYTRGFMFNVDDYAPYSTWLCMTSTGGFDWGVNATPYYYGFNSPSGFNSANTFFGVKNGAIVRTTDNGYSYMTIFTGANSTNICAVDGSVLVVTASDSVFRSTNSGGSFYFTAKLQYWLNFINFPDQNTGYITAGSGKIFKSTDKGLTWWVQATPNADNMTATCFLNANTGFAIGSNGTLLKTTDGGGAISGAGITQTEIPDKYTLSQNYPNPFNPVTNIKFDIKKDGFVKLNIYNSAGMQVASLINGNMKAGSYNVTWSTSSYSSGIYFCKMEAGEFREVKKMALVK